MLLYENENAERYCFIGGKARDRKRSKIIRTYGIITLKEKLGYSFCFCPGKETVFLGVRKLYLAASPTINRLITPPRIDGSSGPINFAARTYGREKIIQENNMKGIVAKKSFVLFFEREQERTMCVIARGIIRLTVK